MGLTSISLNPGPDWRIRLIAGSGLKDTASQHSGHRAACLRPSNCPLLLGAKTWAGGVLPFAAQQTAALRTELQIKWRIRNTSVSTLMITGTGCWFHKKKKSLTLTAFTKGQNECSDLPARKKQEQLNTYLQCNTCITPTSKCTWITNKITIAAAGSLMPSARHLLMLSQSTYSWQVQECILQTAAQGHGHSTPSNFCVISEMPHDIAHSSRRFTRERGQSGNTHVHSGMQAG